MWRYRGPAAPEAILGDAVDKLDWERVFLRRDFITAYRWRSPDGNRRAEISDGTRQVVVRGLLY